MGVRALVGLAALNVVCAQRTSLSFNYGWRFHYGPAADDFPGPAGAPVVYFPRDLGASNDVNCSGIYNNPNRVTPFDCATACAYNPECFVWIQYQRSCYHGNASTVCTHVDTPQYPTSGGMRQAPYPLRTNYSYSAAGFDVSGLQLVDVPHDAHIVTNNSFTNGTDMFHGYLPRNVSYYAKRFTLPASWNSGDDYISLLFEGVVHFAQIWLNGQYLGEHTASYTQFAVRLDNVSALKYGVGNINTVVVRADASFGSGHWYEGGGLYRSVHLQHMSMAHFVNNGVFVVPSAPAPGSPLSAVPVPVTAEFECAGTGVCPATSVRVRFDLYSAVTGQLVATNTTGTVLMPPTGITAMADAILSVDLSAAGALWSVQQPSNRYTVVATLLDARSAAAYDSVNVSTAFRHIKFDAQTGFSLNGEPLKFRGFSNHNSFTGTGVAMPPRLDLFRAQALRALGGNTWRMSHNPYRESTYDILDALGVLVWTENRDFGDEYVQQMADMVKTQRNHPSIIMYSLCNEIECVQPTLSTAAAFIAAGKAFDVSRPYTANSLEEDGLYALLDVQGLSHQNDAKFEQFHQQYPTLPLVLSECCSCSSQRNSRNVSACMSEQNAPGLLPYVSGSLGVWTLADYIGESGGWPLVSCSFGQLDLAGYPKSNAWWYRSQWLAAAPASDPGRPPVPSLTVVRITSLLDRLPPASRDGTTAIIGITSAHGAELIVDNKSYGVQAANAGAPMQWNNVPATPAPRNATLVARDSSGRSIASHTVLAPGAPAALSLTLDAPSPLTGTGSAVLLDGEDVALARVSLVDSTGVLVSTVVVNVTLSVVSGPGRLLGIGNGDPGNHQPQQGSVVATYLGLARAIVQVAVDCTSSNRDLIAMVDVDGNQRTTVIPPGGSCPTSPIILQAAAAGYAPVTLAIPVSGNVAADSVLAVAASSAGLLMPQGYPYMDNFSG